MSNNSLKSNIKSALQNYQNNNFADASIAFFDTLGYNTQRRINRHGLLFEDFEDAYIKSNNAAFNHDIAFADEWQSISMLFQLGEDELKSQNTLFSNQGLDQKLWKSYLFFSIELSGDTYSRTALSGITREVNRLFKMPVLIVFKYGNHLSFAIINRRPNQKESDKIVLEYKVSLIKDIDIENPHRAHVDILEDFELKNLSAKYKIKNFQDLFFAWRKAFSIQTLNDRFYKDLQDWFYYAKDHVKLPFKPSYVTAEENTKNFLVRLLARTMFCWFVKEKGLINPELLELTDWEENLYPLTHDTYERDFLQSNSYYRGILQNIFFNALNRKDKNSLKDFKWTKFLHQDFDIKNFTDIPYLNGGVFDNLKDQDNAEESHDDTVLRVPNFLFYGTTQTGVHKGLNQILKQYKFTLEENTPLEEVIALDPEMLGLVFENLLAELDPNLEESTKKSIRKLTGSYYTPRQIIQEMVNESLFIYLKKHIDRKDYYTLNDLIYKNEFSDDTNIDFCKAIVKAIDTFKVLDPACGSGAFPMGMLHRLVEILKKVDANNKLWLKYKLQAVDAAYREGFEKVLTQHLDDYSRKLGIIRDSIYGIDIQPLAVQITKLRFFISLLIDQNVSKGLTPMPNIETKIICANSLNNIEVNLFDANVIDTLKSARLKYYQPDLATAEKEKVTNEIVDALDVAFPSFSFRITGKNVSGQNKVFIRDWFTHATLAAPFFNMDFFILSCKALVLIV